MLHDQRGLVIVGSTQVKGNPVGRVAQSHGSGERRNKRNFFCGHHWQSRQAGGRANIAKQAKNPVS